ncbi:ABC-2 transporter permease [Nocardioides jensenii]|uniref:ABC-2 transporter permease n=1 Tax=Nocardioides jensenii TaxID=1843 RepID=UPI000836B3B1|nr:ABC-2 transporter permease [Nocardioides jensenii]
MAEKKSSSGKKIVRADKATTPRSGGSGSRGRSNDTGVDEVEPTWKPTPEAKKKATTFRLIAAALWVLAIAGELFGIFWVLRQDDVNMVLLIALIVVIGALAMGGSFLWKKANRLDPASRQDTVRFFVQNQLGAIITVIAFLPLIVMIFLNDTMDKKDKAIAGGIGIAVMAVATLFGIEWDAPSVEQYTEETNQVEDIVGENLVYWTKSGEVFHLCAEAKAVNRESKDGKIYEGTVAEAHEAGKSRLTKQIAQETRECGFDTPDTETSDAPASDDPEPSGAVEPSPSAAE